MAGTLKTDLLAITMLAADQTTNASGVGVNVKALQQALVVKAQDLLRDVNVLNAILPSGDAKTALGTVITDLG